MKKGVVVEIGKDGALIMQVGGGFVRVPADSAWAVGDIVTVPTRTQKRTKPSGSSLLSRSFFVAACFTMVLLISFTCYYYLGSTVTFVSLDVNPSIEFGFNRMGNVSEVAALNPDGESLAGQLGLKGQKCADVFENILSSPQLETYLGEDSHIVFALYAEGNDEELRVTRQILVRALSEYQEQFPEQNLHLYIVEEQDVEAARALGVSPGRMAALRALQALDPDATMEQFEGQGVSAIYEAIEQAR